MVKIQFGHLKRIHQKILKISNEYYLNVVQIIMYFEADILGEKFAWEVNRNKRFDFRENTKCLNEYIF